MSKHVLPYTKEELDAGLIELGKKINKQYVYLKGQCRTNSCTVNLSRYNMCYGIEKSFRKSQQDAGIQKGNISNEAIFKIIKKAVAKESPRIVEKYNSNEAKHLERIKKERQLRTRQAKINYRFMFAPENNWPKPILIKMEPTDDLLFGANVSVGFIKSENVESEILSQNSSKAATIQSAQNINEFNSVPSIASIDNEIYLESEQIYENLNKSIEGTIPLNYNAFGDDVVTSTQKDRNDGIVNNAVPETSNTQCQYSEEFSSQESYSYSTESILNEFKRKQFLS